ncbi:MAG: hypothetical protein WBO10_14705 [Pyrinomonadaceae bacterium]
MRRILAPKKRQSSIRRGDIERKQKYFFEAEIGSICSWEQVSNIHKVRHGIYQRNGRLISLLTDFGKINPCYPDTHGNSTDTILYTGNGRRGDQKLDAFNRALLDAVDSCIAVPLFNKHAPGKWEFMGHWRVASGTYIFDEIQGRMVWKFTLERT